MAKNKVLTIKICTAKAIAALEARLKTLHADYAAQEEKERVYIKQVADWRKKITVLGRKALSDALKADDNVETWLRTNESGQTYVYAKLDAKATVSKDTPVEPVRTWSSMPEYQYKHIVKEVEQAIRILRMTDEPTVPASTFATLSQYL
jgi:hypothetical protein